MRVSTLSKLPLFEVLAGHDSRAPAIVHSGAVKGFSYGQLLRDVSKAKDTLASYGPNRRRGQRVAFLAENSYDYVVTLLSILGADGIAVPLSPTFPAKELRYVLNHSGASMLLSTIRYHEQAQMVIQEGVKGEVLLKIIDKSTEDDGPTPVEMHWEEPTQVDGGLMLYTSGTTSQPKGVLLPLSAVMAQCQSLRDAWQYTPQDRFLHVLPLHHIHGTVNALLAPLLAGASVEFMFPFAADAVWTRFGGPFSTPATEDTKGEEKVTVFTAVPTIYNRLLSTHPTLSAEMQRATREAVAPENLRLNISGSAALLTSTKKAWAELSNANDLLERYGMTETGMILSCGLAMQDRVDGSVGWPLPSVEVRLVESDTNEVILPGEEVDRHGHEREGEIHVRGPTVFREYWQNPEATRAEFVDADDGRGRWFKTGDIAVRKQIPAAGSGHDEWSRGPMYFIRGRKSVDIIKTGGEKVSALEIERELLSLPQIAEAAVVGLESDAWGQKVAAIVVLDPAHQQTGRPGKKWGPLDMRRALKDRLVNYKIPQEMRVIERGLPRNAMGKVNKKALVKEFFGDAKQ
ncbi:MAG: hypothetical protein M1838_003309 [Thelocarpon superellum]|nr:MAG: hypothetical protein M1838_003309 [Thelocarpon superellum]